LLCSVRHRSAKAHADLTLIRARRTGASANGAGRRVESVSKKGLPLIKSRQFIDRSSGDKWLLAQQTDKLGVTLPIAPGTCDVIGTTI
jgi:glyoxylate carboligase